MTSIADKVKQLVLFQRHPHYVIPNGDGPVSHEKQDNIRQEFDGVWARVQNSFFGHNVEESRISALSVSDKKREEIFEQAWQEGYAFHFLFGVFKDIISDEQANEEAARFIRKKISEIVTDPEKARKLTPTGLWTRRPINGANYYEIFNKDHVDIVDIRATPMEIIPSGVRTSDGTVYELDVIILATGFQAFDGSYSRIEIRGRHGKTLQEHWEAGPKSYLAIANTGFPNLFTVQGPQGPYGNVPPIIEPQVELIASLVSHAEFERKKRPQERHNGEELTVTVEANPKAEDEWAALCQNLSDASLLSKGEEGSWLLGTNIVGEKPKVLFYLGGLASYRKHLREEKDSRFQGFAISL